MPAYNPDTGTVYGPINGQYFTADSYDAALAGNDQTYNPNVDPDLLPGNASGSSHYLTVAGTAALSGCGPQPGPAADGTLDAYEAWQDCINKSAGNASAVYAGLTDTEAFNKFIATHPEFKGAAAPDFASKNPKLVNFTGDCNQPKEPGFPGWASYADATNWANACNGSKVTIPYIPPTKGSSDATGTAGRGAPAATPIGAAGLGTPRANGIFGFGGGEFGGESGSYCDYYPDDPLCGIWFGGGIVLNGGPGGGGVSQPVILSQGLSATDVHGLIDGGLKTVWSAVVGAMDAIVLVAISAIQSALTALGNALKAAFSILSRLSGFILNALRSLFTGVVKGILQVLQDVRSLLKKLATDIILPLAKAIVKMRDRLLEIYKRVIRPLVIVIQDVRKVLNILAIFHVPFAAKLDRTLADLERRITAPLLLLLRYSNQVANWLNLIVTANYLLQKPMFLASLNAYKGESINLLANAMTRPAGAAAIAAAQSSMGTTAPKQTAADLTTFLATGSGPYAVPIAEASGVFDQALVAQG